MNMLRRSGAWPYAVNKTTIIGLCVSSSSYYDYWNKPFSQVKDFPTMVAWLLEAPDAKSNEEIWGDKEPNLTQLSIWLVEEAKNIAVRAEKKAEKKRSKKSKGKQREM